uniref:VWFD domain-containing protein n=1 Tax=Graphocephala atropunctata TaxID=36148 RepID=A0A1B6MSS2_9HEMI
MTVYATYSTSYSHRVSRYGLFIKGNSSEVKLTTILETPIDIATNMKRRLSEDLMRTVYVDFVYKNSGHSMYAFTKGEVGLSRARLMQLRGSPLLEACSQLHPQYFDSLIDLRCQQMQDETKQISFGNFTVYYDDYTKYFEEKAHTYIDAAKVMLPRVEVKRGEGVNTMSLVVDVNARTESINAFIKTPVTSINIYRYPLSKLPMRSFLEWRTQNHEPREYCGVSSRRVRTFDGAEYRYKMGEDWHLVAQDCTGKYGFAVLARPEDNNDLGVEVNIGDLAVLALTAGPKVYMNRHIQYMSMTRSLLRLTNRHGELLAHVVYTPDHSIHVRLPQYHLQLIFSNTSLILRAEQNLQGRLCGLCGENTHSGVELFHTAKGSSAKSPAEFFESYRLKGFETETVEVE